MHHPFVALTVGIFLGGIAGFVLGSTTEERSVESLHASPTGEALPERIDSRSADSALGSVASMDSPALVELRELVARVDERIGGLESLLLERASVADSARVPAEDAGASEAPLAQLVKSVQALEAMLLEQAQGSEALHAARLQAAREARPEADWTALQEILDAWSISEAEGRKVVQLMSDITILERFGPPGLIYPVQTGDRWVYGQNYDPQRDAYALQIVMQIEEQVVTGLWVEGL